MPEEIEQDKRHIAADTAAGVFLFFATSAVVWWQNSRLTVLYDVSGILENSMRMAEGLVPYRDFPFPYAPLTFLVQAAIIRFTGAVYWHHVVYVCIVGGLATVFTWRILLHLLRDSVPGPKLAAFLLSLPMTVLGIYCVFPHPFYDPDATFVLLAIILLTLNLERKNFPPVLTFLLGILCVLPLFIKQNIGLAFIASTALCLLIAIDVNLRHKKSVRGPLMMLGGSAMGLLIAVGIVEYAVGLDNYWKWTITFASARRAPSFTDMLSVYQDWMLAFWVVIFILGAYLLLRNSERKLWQTIMWIGVMAMPFIWPVIYIGIDQDASERAERLTEFWPFVFIVSVALAYGFVRRLKGVALALPFVIICAAHGVFLSQQLWGSTYGIWPLLLILIAILLRQLYDPEAEQFRGVVTTFAALISVSLLIAGAFYVISNERLDYVDLEDGELEHSSLPQLQGLAIRGTFLSDFEELVKWSDENIPRGDGILLLPGEDLFFYTTGRTPHFPILTFDYSYNPYNPEQLREQVLADNIEWIVIKNDLQIEKDNTIDDKDKLFEPLQPDFRHIESLNNYEVYKRRHPDDPPDEEDDDPGDDSGDNSPDDDSN